VIVGLLLIVGVGYGLWMRKNTLETAKLKGELANEISSLKTQINQRDKEIGNLRTEIQEQGRLKDTEKTALTAEISSLTTQINQRDKEIGNLRTEIQEQGRLKEQYMAKNEEAGRYKRQQNELSQANRDLEEQIKTLSTEISRGKAQAQQLTTERTKLTGQLKQIKAGANELASAREKADRTVQIQQQLIKSLKEEIAAGQVKITQLTSRTAIRLEEKLLFYSGHASIKPSGLAVLNKIGKTLEKIRDRHIQVEGHTDTVPIRWEFKEKYPTNWELSTARATTIVRYLIDEVGIKPTGLSAAGYAFYRPVASNDSPEGRQENRRVEFALLPIS
jgi:chemotaxis protein MotB